MGFMPTLFSNVEIQRSILGMRWNYACTKSRCPPWAEQLDHRILEEGWVRWFPTGTKSEVVRGRAELPEREPPRPPPGTWERAARARNATRGPDLQAAIAEVVWVVVSHGAHKGGPRSETKRSKTKTRHP